MNITLTALDISSANVVDFSATSFLDISSVQLENVVPDKGALNVVKTELLTLKNFHIKTVTVCPHNQCTIEIGIVVDGGRTIFRAVTLTGSDYALWGDDDDFLYTYVRENIDEIYGNY
jgi:hypothetical protein